MNNKSTTNYSIIAIIFLILLLIIFSVAAVCSFPGKSQIVINNSEYTQLQPSSDWHIIKEDSYSVIKEFGEITVSDSTFLYPKTYYYFDIQINNNGESFIMPIRVGEKVDLLREGQTPELCGMVSELHKDEIKYYNDNDRSIEYVNNICLNDNDEDRSDKSIMSIVFGILSILDILLLIRIIKVNKK